MNLHEKCIAIAELSDPKTYPPGTGAVIKDEPIWQRANGWPITCPRYPRDLNEMLKARRYCITTPALRVAYMNNLRLVVGRLCPRNGAGQPIVSDFDCMDAAPEEHAEAFCRTFWPEKFKKGE